MKDSTFKHFNPMKLREKYSVDSVKKRNNYSSFWMDNDWNTRNTSIFDDDEVELNAKPKTDLVALAGYRRAISNFVTIVTGESNIKVKFNDGDDSYTDGKTVTIGSKLDDKLFDPSVGLALHEGSHIKLSDFDLLRNLENNIPQEYFERALKKGYSSRYGVLGHIKNLLNYVEDRRIDNFVFTTSPGYKGYYHSMYEKYFYSKIVDKALLSDEYTEENMESYMFRIINLTNKNTNLDALNGLRQIWKDLDIKNIGVLGNTQLAFNVALVIYSTILDNLKDGIEETDEDGNKSTKPNDESNGDGESKELSDEEFERLKDAMSSGDVKQGHSNGSDIQLTDNQKKQLENAIKKQNKFMNGGIQKKKVTKKESKELKTIEDSGMTYENVGKDVGWNKNTVKCLVVRKLTKDLIESSGGYDGGLNILSPNRYGYHSYGSNDDTTGFVEDGIRLGTVLGRKLQVRGESRETKWTRLDSGRIDKRLIAELGFGNERVFNTSFVESYSDAFLHISVDASGSMSGRKWDNTMTSVVAITKAASMIQNVDVVVSIRSTQNVGGRGRSSNTVPLILIAYDSRVDKFNKVKNLFAHMKVSGTTPEGLTFEAIMDEIVPTTKDRDSYFLNFSDGMPMFSTDGMSYYQSDALNHTKKMVNEMRTRGIKVLSYFIGDSDDYGREDTMRDFKIMYGKDAQFVNVTSVMSISKTMNKKFLEK